MKYNVVTGAAGFIGSCMVTNLNMNSITNILAVDDFSRSDKNLNLEQKTIAGHINRKEFFNWLIENHQQVECIYHLGARTDTSEFNVSVFDELNFNYSCQLWKLCSQYNIPLLYASSAATYGMGEWGYIDDHSIVEKLTPLNPYGESKNNFDKWVLMQQETPPFWAGMKFFNVFGPNEYHKGRMASVVFHAFKQITETGKVKLFKSHHKDYEDGMQLRDFVYVKDVVNVLYFMMQQKPESGLYNLGTGQARAFYHLASGVFNALGIPENIEFVDTPEDIRDKYQYFTEANLDKLKNKAGYSQAFYSLEEGIYEYVTKYLDLKEYL